MHPEAVWCLLPCSSSKWWGSLLTATACCCRVSSRLGEAQWQWPHSRCWWKEAGRTDFRPASAQRSQWELSSAHCLPLLIVMPSEAVQQRWSLSSGKLCEKLTSCWPILSEEASRESFPPPTDCHR